MPEVSWTSLSNNHDLVCLYCARVDCKVTATSCLNPVLKGSFKEIVLWSSSYYFPTIGVPFSYKGNDLYNINVRL